MASLNLINEWFGMGKAIAVVVLVAMAAVIAPALLVAMVFLAPWMAAVAFWGAVTYLVLSPVGARLRASWAEYPVPQAQEDTEWERGWEAGYEAGRESGLAQARLVAIAAIQEPEIVLDVDIPAEEEAKRQMDALDATLDRMPAEHRAEWDVWCDEVNAKQEEETPAPAPALHDLSHEELVSLARERKVKGANRRWSRETLLARLA